MKYALYLIFPLLFLVNIRLSGQNLGETGAKHAIQGLWELSTNPNITICISGDTLVEFSTEDFELGVHTCVLSQKPCDNEVFTPSPTGIYFSIENAGNVELCAAILALTDKYLKLQIDKDTVIQFEKLL